MIYLSNSTQDRRKVPFSTGFQWVRFPESLLLHVVFVYHCLFWHCIVCPSIDDFICLPLESCTCLSSVFQHVYLNCILYLLLNGIGNYIIIIAFVAVNFSPVVKKIIQIQINGDASGISTRQSNQCMTKTFTFCFKHEEFSFYLFHSMENNLQSNRLIWLRGYYVYK